MSLILVIGVSDPAFATFPEIFSPFQNISNTPTLHESNPDVTFDGVNTHVAWQAWDGTSNEIFLNTFDGATWTLQNISNTPTIHENNPSVATDGTNIYVAWQARVGSNDEIFLNTFDGATWTLQNISNTPTTTRENSPSIATDGTNVYVTWIAHDGTSNDVFLNTFDGATWTLQNISNTPTIHENNPSVATDVTNIYVAWQAWDGTSNEIFLNTFDGATWTLQNISNTPTIHENSPALAASNTGINLVWSSSGDVVFTKSFDGATWTLSNISNVPAFASSFGLDTDGTNVYVALLAWDGQSNEVFVTSAETVPQNPTFAQLNLIKNSGDFPQTFDFTIQGSTLIPKSITTVKTGSESIGSERLFLDPGVYSILETIPSNWILNSSVCENNGVDMGSLNTLSINTGDDIVCTFTNMRSDAIGEIHGIKLQDGILLPDVIINMTNNAETVNRETITDSNGEYWFMDLIPGTYTVLENVPPFSVQVFPTNNDPHNVILGLGDIVTGINFENHFVGPSEIQGTIFQDLTPFGSFDLSDTVIANQWVTLYQYNPSLSFVGQVQTDVNGVYSFSNLEPGIYEVRSNAPFFPAVQTVPQNNQPAVATLSGQIVNLDIGFDFSFVTVTGKTFFDSVPENQVLDTGESPVKFTQVCAIPGNTCTSSNSNGDYTLKLPPGNYNILAGSTNNAFPTFVSVSVSAPTTGQTISGIDIPYRDLIPLPTDMTITTSNGDRNGVPTIVRSQDLIITKDISICTPVGNPLVTLTLDDAIALTQFMQFDTGITWTSNFGPISGVGAANIQVDIDCPSDTIGYPEDITLFDPSNDVIQIGDVLFIDPSGQIINQCTSEPLSDSTVTLKQSVPQGTDNFIIPPNFPWSPPVHLPSDNPQITGVDGRYGWLVVPGDYTVTATKPGFESNTSPVVTIPPPVTGLDIFLTPVNGCPDVIAPVITVELEELTSEDDEGIYRVIITATDAVDPTPVITADINGITVTNNQLVKLEIDDESESKFKEAKEKQCEKSQEKADKKLAKGKPVPVELQVKLLICDAGGVLEIEDLSFVLSATATDSTGNSITGTAIPTFTPEVDDDSDEESDDEEDD